MADPFIHHPGLRGEILDPEESFFFDFTKEKILALLDDNGVPLPETHSDNLREALRRQTLAQADEGDVWIFAYGSLMWDPGFHFAEIRRARIEGYTRQFVLKDELGARGDMERPGVMAALAPGPGCDGMAFRIAAEARSHPGRADRVSGDGYGRSGIKLRLHPRSRG